MNRRSGQSTYDGKIAGLYDLEETLGRGHFAVVKLARHVFTGEKVAVKVIDKCKLDDISRAHLFQEVRCMKLVQHPNVVRLYEVIDTQTKLYLILELGDGGDLYDYIMRHDSGLTEEVAKTYFRQIVRAISYCHRLHVVHRDLKPENVVFFEKHGTVKLTDFGFSNRFSPGQKLETSCGSLAYSAPEILLGDSYDAPAVDIWSLGVILYMLVCGQAPFQEANDSETLTMIMDCKYSIPAHVSDACKKLIARMLVRKPESRATLVQIASDPWLGIGTHFDATDEFPLVSRQHVSDEQHNSIVTKMVNGDIATKEDILEALERNEYNHITATYFLLAERKLRAHRQESVAQNCPELLNVEARYQDDLRHNDQRTQQNPSSSVSQSSLTIPSTADGVPQNVRTRKCSIVQEEEGEDDISSCSDHEELVSSSPLNSLSRRGSRSEGKLSQILQEHFSNSSEKPSVNRSVRQIQYRGPRGSILPSHKFTVVRVQLDMLTTSPERLKNCLGGRKKIFCGTESTKPLKNCIEASSFARSDKWQQGARKTSVSIRRIPTSQLRIEENETSLMIPSKSSIPFLSHSSNDIANVSLKYRALPMSDSIQSEISLVTGIPEDVYAMKLPKELNQYEKVRATPGSSFNARDDDSDNRKERGHKLGVTTDMPLLSRHDSHEDSSESQDPGSNCGGGGKFGSDETEQNSGSADSEKDQERSETTSTETISGGDVERCSDTQSVSSSRRHRTGCRRAGETRLRESQSLNRITEVQEAEVLITENTTRINNNQEIVHTIPSTIPRIMIGDVAPEIPLQVTAEKTKGFGAKFLQGWNLTKTQVYQELNMQGRRGDKFINENREKIPSGNEIARTSEKGMESRSQRVRLLARYFSAHKKLCVPLPFSSGESKLYKARSCGNVSKDRVSPPSPKAMLFCAAEDKWKGQKWSIKQQQRHQNHGNDGDINQNLDFSEFVQDRVLSEGCAGFSPICHIHLNDPSKRCSLC